MTKSLFLASASLFLSVGFVASAAGSSGTAFKAGAWEITRSVTGGPRDQAPQAERYCFTEAQLRADPAAPFKTEPRRTGDEKAPKCTLGAVSMKDGKASFTATCKGPMGSIKPKWSGTYGATSFDMSGKARAMFMSIKMKSTGRYLGACAAK
jgi:Protein of unknown function (DUF3617)